MTMKKSLIAMAVAGAVTAPATAAAAEAYGFVFAGLDTVDADAGGVPNIFASNFAAAQDGESFAADTPETRFGFKGSEDLGNGLTGSYRFEFGLSTDSVGAGGVNEDSDPELRLAWVAVGGDWGQVKGGTMWSVAYEYAGWNVFRSRGHGGAAWYRMFNGGFAGLLDGTATLTPDNSSGLRVDNSWRYTYGGGGYSSDPFTFSISTRTAAGATPAADDTFDMIALGAQGTFGQFTVNGFVQDSNGDTDVREPTIWGIGGRWTNGTTHVGLELMQTDIDGGASSRAIVSTTTTAGPDGILGSADDVTTITPTTGGDTDGDPFGIIVEATHDFPGAWSGMLMLAAVDGDDAIHDMDSNIFIQADYAFSSRTHFQVEFEHAELSSTDSVAFEPSTSTDREEAVLSVGLIHNF